MEDLSSRSFTVYFHHCIVNPKKVYEENIEDSYIQQLINIIITSILKKDSLNVHVS